jgi:hypothetical protein
MLQIFSITSDQTIPQMTITHHVIGELVNTRGIKADNKFTKSKYIKGVLVGEIPIKDAIKPYIHLEHDSKESRVLVPTETRNGELFVDKKVMEPQIESAKNMAKEWIKIKAEVKKAQNKAKSARMKREYAEATNKVSELKPFQVTMGNKIHLIPTDGKIVVSPMLDPIGRNPYSIEAIGAPNEDIRTLQGNMQPALGFKTQEQAQRYADKLNRAIERANKPPSPKKAKKSVDNSTNPKNTPKKSLTPKLTKQQSIRIGAGLNAAKIALKPLKKTAKALSPTDREVDARPAKYAKGKIATNHYLAKEYGGKWSGREGVYIISPAGVKKMKDELRVKRTPVYQRTVKEHLANDGAARLFEKESKELRKKYKDDRDYEYGMEIQGANGLLPYVNELKGQHRQAVVDALAKGLKVPAKVLKDYPELKNQ